MGFDAASHAAWKIIILCIHQRRYLGNKFPPRHFVFAAIRRLTVRMVSFAKRIKMQCIPSKSQNSLPILQQHAPPGKLGESLFGRISLKRPVGATSTKGQMHIRSTRPRRQTSHNGSYSLTETNTDIKMDTCGQQSNGA